MGTFRVQTLRSVEAGSEVDQFRAVGEVSVYAPTFSGEGSHNRLVFHAIKRFGEIQSQDCLYVTWDAQVENVLFELNVASLVDKWARKPCML